MPILKMTDLDLAGKKVVLREDLNVPIENGKISGEQRIKAALPTIKYALEKSAGTIILSHLGQPEEGKFDPKLSLAPVAVKLSELLNKEVRFEKEWLNGVKVGPGEVVLCENVRFNKGEKKDDEDLAKKLAALGDIFIMDAFATAHRAQASTHGIAKFAPVAAAGPLLVAELEALSKALENPQRPLVAIVGGAKVSTKFKVLENLLDKVDRLIVGGGIANTFIAASEYNVGKSLYEAEFVSKAKELLDKARHKQAAIPLPLDVIVATECAANSLAITKGINEVVDDEMILDIGPKSVENLRKILLGAKTIVWNGPIGVFEYQQFANGTKGIAETIIKSKAFTIAGGGDTVAAIDAMGVSDKISYISTAGGAFLEFLEGTKLPAIAILEERYKKA